MSQTLRDRLAGRRGSLLLVAGLAIAITAVCLVNKFVQDDGANIRDNDRLHHLSGLWRVFVQPYWQPPFRPDLYRPLSSLLFGLEWIASGGHPWFFRVVSIVLYALLGAAVCDLLRRLVRPEAALVAAIYFVLQPVHSEAVAAAVNQSELLVGLLAALTVTRWLKVREQPAISGRDGAALLALYGAACMVKESGVMVLPLVGAAEIFLVRDRRPAGPRLALVRPWALAATLVAVAFIAVRTTVLAGDAIGSFTAEALDGLTLGGRALTMLGVVPRWAALLTWPLHLQADYSPQEIVAAHAMGAAQWAGVAILALLLAVFVACWRRRPLLSFAIAWLGIAIFPVHNVLVPTGIVLAERTMLLPSIGTAILAAALLDLLWPELLRARAVARTAVAVAALLLATDGAIRMTQRLRIWRDDSAFWTQLYSDAPNSYRAAVGLGEVTFALGDKSWGELLMRRAMQLWPNGLLPYGPLADRYRLAGYCEPAMPLYRRALEIIPARPTERASLIACLMHLGRYAEARKEARIGMTWEIDYATFARFAATADSALKTGAPPGSVGLRVPSDTVKARLVP